jgi:hypothetical protein
LPFFTIFSVKHRQKWWKIAKMPKSFKKSFFLFLIDIWSDNFIMTGRFKP